MLKDQTYEPTNFDRYEDFSLRKVKRNEFDLSVRERKLIDITNNTSSQTIYTILRWSTKRYFYINIKF